MSLVIARSLVTDDGANFSVRFDRPLELTTGSEVMLESAVMENSQTYQVVAGENRVYFKEAAGDPQLEATLTPGTYVVGELVQELARAMNASVLQYGLQWNGVLVRNSSQEPRRCKLEFVRSDNTYVDFSTTKFSANGVPSANGGFTKNVDTTAWDSVAIAAAPLCAGATVSITTPTGEGVLMFWLDSSVIDPSGPMPVGFPLCEGVVGIGIGESDSANAGLVVTFINGVAATTGSSIGTNKLALVKTSGSIRTGLLNSGGSIVLFGSAIPHFTNAKLYLGATVYDENSAVTNTTFYGVGAPPAQIYPADDSSVVTNESGMDFIEAAKRTEVTFYPDTAKSLLGFVQSSYTSPQVPGYAFQAENGFGMSQKSNYVIAIPNLPLKAWDSNTGRINPILAVIPSMYQSDDDTIVYNAPFPLWSPLHFKSPSAVNELQIQIRDANGELAVLDGQTTLALRFRGLEKSS